MSNTLWEGSTSGVLIGPYSARSPVSYRHDITDMRLHLPLVEFSETSTRHVIWSTYCMDSTGSPVSTAAIGAPLRDMRQLWVRMLLQEHSKPRFSPSEIYIPSVSYTTALPGGNLGVTTELPASDIDVSHRKVTITSQHVSPLLDRPVCVSLRRLRVKTLRSLITALDNYTLETVTA